MIHYLSENWSDIVGILAAAHVLALVIVNVTPSKRDDELYNKLYKVVELFAGVITKTAKK